MRAALIKAYGEPPEVVTAERPEPAEGEELVAVEVAGLNPVDLAIASGKFDAGSPSLPYVAGLEGIVHTRQNKSKQAGLMSAVEGRERVFIAAGHAREQAFVGLGAVIGHRRGPWLFGVA